MQKLPALLQVHNHEAWIFQQKTILTLHASTTFPLSCLQFLNSQSDTTPTGG
jgi:hypothetical protein